MRWLRISNWETPIGSWYITMYFSPIPHFVAEHKGMFGGSDKKAPEWMRQSSCSFDELVGEIDRIVKAH